MKSLGYETVVNLSDGFAPFPGEEPVRKFTFPGGEQHIDLSNVCGKSALLTTRLLKAEDTFYLLMAADALRRRGVRRLGLFAPYLPYARQDRVALPGEPLAAAVYADIINQAGFDDVFGLDAHSYVMAAVIRNYRALDWWRFVTPALDEIEAGRKSVPILVAPDAGAAKKISSLADARACDWKQANKYRDPATGAVTMSCDIPGRNRTVIVVDDICDGGATFVAIAASNQQHELHLVVTHGIFSKGIGTMFLAGYRSIHTTDSWGNSVAAFPEFVVHPVPTEVAA